MLLKHSSTFLAHAVSGALLLCGASLWQNKRNQWQTQALGGQMTCNSDKRRDNHLFQRAATVRSDTIIHLTVPNVPWLLHTRASVPGLVGCSIQLGAIEFHWISLSRLEFLRTWKQYFLEGILVSLSQLPMLSRYFLRLWKLQWQIHISWIATFPRLLSFITCR